MSPLRRYAYYPCGLLKIHLQPLVSVFHSSCPASISNRVLGSFEMQSSIRFRLSLYTEEAVICESKIAPLSMPRGTGVFGDSAPEIETEKYNHTDIDFFIMG